MSYSTTHQDEKLNNICVLLIKKGDNTIVTPSKVPFLTI